MTWSKTIGVERLELLNETLELALRTTSDGPLEISGKLRDNVLAGIFSGEAGRTEDDQFVRTRRHGWQSHTRLLRKGERCFL